MAGSGLLPALHRTRYSALRPGVPECLFLAAIAPVMPVSMPSRASWPAEEPGDNTCLRQQRRAGQPGTAPRPGIPAALMLDGSDPAVGPGPVGIRPWITAVRPPVGDQDQPGIDQLAPVEHAQDRVLAARNEHGTAAFGHLSVRAHLLRRALIGGMRDDQVA